MELSLDAWRAAARASEGPLLKELARRALAKAPCATALRDLSIGAGFLEEADREAALKFVRWGLAEKGEAEQWDAVHVAGELGAVKLVPDLEEVLGDAKKRAASVRARAVEAYAAAAERPAAEALLGKIKEEDESWTVRRLAGDALRLLGQDKGYGGELLGRLQALIRVGCLRLEADEMISDLESLARLGLRVPSSYLLFWQEILPGGRLVFVEGAGSGKEKDGESLFLTPPQKLASKSVSTAADLTNFAEYVWARYIDGAKTYAKVDEDYALKRYAEHYEGLGRADADAFNYGVLLFEAAFRDEANRAEHLLRCRDILTAYKMHTGGEEWEEIDDRLMEAEDLIAQDGLAWRGSGCSRPLVIGRWQGVIDLLLDLESPEVFADDPDESGGPWLVAPCLAAFLNAPNIVKPSSGTGEDPLEALARVQAHIEAGAKRDAARLFVEVLEADASTRVLKRAAELLVSADMERLDTAQLLATIPLAGDKQSMDLVREILMALPVEVAGEVIQAASPYNEDGSPIALLIDAAAAIRKRSHGTVKTLAKHLRDTRAKAHTKTMKNPWYKR